MIQDRIKSLRLRLGISQSELARRAGYSHEFISQVERGVKSPSIKALQKISLGLGVTPSVLMESNLSEAESEEKIKHEVVKMVDRLPVDKLRIIRDLLAVFPEYQDPRHFHEKFKEIKK
ncbi:MAG: helix-turn-helix transcriptional regulator [Peptococcaceae bacterium]|nr:helix-turn-helix transcriptional regulator [Peptococcaceae bacterium]